MERETERERFSIRGFIPPAPRWLQWLDLGHAAGSGLTQELDDSLPCECQGLKLLDQHLLLL